MTQCSVNFSLNRYYKTPQKNFTILKFNLRLCNISKESCSNLNNLHTHHSHQVSGSL